MAGFMTWSGVPDPTHFIFANMFAIGLVRLRFFLDKFVSRDIAACLLDADSLPLNVNTTPNRRMKRAKRERLKRSSSVRSNIGKFCDSMWKLTYYATAEISILYILYYEPWSRSTRNYFQDWPNQELKFSLAVYYMCQCGYYLYSFTFLVKCERSRADFPILMAHHVVAFVLIVLSYITGFFRIGSVILALHDASDVFLEAAKVCKYTEREIKATLLFALFAISWVGLRLVVFPFWIIRASSIEIINHLDISEAFGRMVYYVFNALLLTLQIFHIYWWCFICRMMCGHGRVGDSDSEDDG